MREEESQGGKRKRVREDEQEGERGRESQGGKRVREEEKEGERGREKWTGRSGEREDRETQQLDFNMLSNCQPYRNYLRKRQKDRQRERPVEKG